MNRIIYVSCGRDERELAAVFSIRQFLASSGAEVDFGPDLRSAPYSRMEEAIERCDAFLAVFAATSSVATSLVHAANYAFGLNRLRMIPRPRLVGICVDPWGVPRAFEHIPFEWLSDESYDILMCELPSR